MLKRTRTILFWICLFLFLIAAPSMVLYSQGYRIDFDARKITQTGGLFLKTSPKQAEIYINGELEDKTDFLFGSVLIENLLPKEYKIEARKEGFQPWEKTLGVKEKEATEAKNIFLFPADLNWNVLSEGAERFWFFPDEKKIILEETDYAGWSLKLYDLNKNVKSQLINENNISKDGAALLDLAFTDSQNIVSLKTEVKEQIKYFSLDINKNPSSLNEQKITATSSENMVISEKIGNDEYYLDRSGYLFKNGERIISQPFPVKQETDYSLKIFSDFVFLQEGQTLYKLNPDLKIFEKFFEGLNRLELSPDAKKLLLVSDYEFWLFFLDNDTEQPQRRAGDKIILSRLSDKIKDCFWLNYAYFGFFAGDKIKISEIDDRDKLNVVEIKTPVVIGEASAIFWSKINKKLYLLSHGTLYSSETLIQD